MNRIEVVKGDITKIAVDVVVNAANSSLLGGGGVDGAIHRAGGPEVLNECRDIRNRQGKCKTGEAVVTTAGNLPATFIVHTVGPVWNGGYKNEPELLANCYRNSLKLAVEKNAETIAFPNISTGIYGYPKPGAAKVAVATVHEFLETNESIKKVIFVCFDDDNYTLYKNLL
ncbi:O-acetyl-ADP-ribose deacetylase [Flavobacterium sp. RNTU_13]|uniref:O-acetyl-ADP-ribose deacetylase n=1 Tax=Flavobacterium sp. RNTU_13 TaxID=3375145 RepID=UPI0039886D26